MSDRDALLAAIVSQPDEDTPRLAFADWLDEHALTPADQARAEFIRVQIEANRLPADEPTRALLQARAESLLATHERSWRPPEPDPLALFFKWQRGFITVLDPAARGVFNGADSLKALAAFPLAEELDLSFCLGGEEFQHVPTLPNLRSLAVGGNASITDVSVARIGSWKTLRRLRLNGRELSDTTLQHLAGLTDLRELDLSYSGVTDAALPRLAPLTSLESLDFTNTGLVGWGSPLSVGSPG